MCFAYSFSRGTITLRGRLHLARNFRVVNAHDDDVRFVPVPGKSPYGLIWVYSLYRSGCRTRRKVARVYDWYIFFIAVV